MKHVLLAFLSLTVVVAFGQTPVTVWEETYGNDFNTQYAFDIVANGQDGLTLLGYQPYGSGTTFLLHLDENGQVMETSSYPPRFEGASLDQTTDGGYFIVGDSASYVSVIKTDAQGNREWQRSYGEDPGYGRYGEQTDDGGLILTGYYYANWPLNTDIFLMKLSAVGNIEWQDSFDFGFNDYAMSVRQTDDGGYILVGQIPEDELNHTDALVIRTDSDGDSLWTRTYGVPEIRDTGYDIQQTDDGGFVIVGETGRFWETIGSKTLVIKTDANGDTLWTSVFGRQPGPLGSFSEYGSNIEQTDDGGYICSVICNMQVNSGYVYKLDEEGDVVWNYHISGEDVSVKAVHVISDGDFIIAGDMGGYYQDALALRLSGTDRVADIVLTPINPPIVIPPEGGEFNFDVVIENYLDVPLIGQSWVDVTLPSGAVFTVSRSDITLDPGEMIQTIAQAVVPGFTPSGVYTLYGRIGRYPNLIIDTDKFTFEKAENAFTGEDHFENDDPSLAGWEIVGWFDDGNSDRVTTSSLFPAEFSITGTYPNPFNAVINAEIAVPESGPFRLYIFNVLGQETVSLHQTRIAPGYHRFVFNATAWASGVYIIRASLNEQETLSRKIVLLR